MDSLQLRQQISDFDRDRVPTVHSGPFPNINLLVLRSDGGETDVVSAPPHWLTAFVGSSVGRRSGRNTWAPPRVKPRGSRQKETFTASMLLLRRTGEFLVVPFGAILAVNADYGEGV